MGTQSMQPQHTGAVNAGEVTEAQPSTTDIVVLSQKPVHDASR